MKYLYYLFILSFLLISCEEEVTPVKYTLTTQVTPSAAGTVNPSSGTYDEGSSVTITASPITNYKFLKWTGTGSGTANPLTFKIISNTTIIAEFELIDADGDGVTDALDKCPDTPVGSTVNSEGCATSQLDSDGDGVSDDMDKCSDTPDGADVDENGCSLSQKDNYLKFTAKYHNIIWTPNDPSDSWFTHIWVDSTNFNFRAEGEINFECLSIPVEGWGSDKFTSFWQSESNFTLNSFPIVNKNDSLVLQWKWEKNSQIVDEYITLFVIGNTLKFNYETFWDNFPNSQLDLYSESFSKSDEEPDCN